MKHKRISLHSLSSIWKRKCDLTSPSVSAARLTVYHVLYRRGIFDASHFVPLELPESGGKHMVGLIITVLVVALPHFITPSPPTPPPLPLPFTTSPRHHGPALGPAVPPWSVPHLTSPHLRVVLPVHASPEERRNHPPRGLDRTGTISQPFSAPAA